MRVIGPSTVSSKLWRVKIDYCSTKDHLRKKITAIAISRAQRARHHQIVLIVVVVVVVVGTFSRSPERVADSYVKRFRRRVEQHLHILTTMHW
jgi:hypothetical protein